MAEVRTGPELIDGERITVFRGVPSTTFPELLTDMTWCSRRDVGEDEARWVVPKGEQPFMEVGTVRLADVEDPNWIEGLVTICDPSRVDVQMLVPVEGHLTADDVRAYWERLDGQIGEERLEQLNDELHGLDEELDADD